MRQGKGGHVLRRLRVKIVAAIMAVAFAVLAIAFAAVVSVATRNAVDPLMHELDKALSWGPEESVTFSIGRGGIGSDGGLSTVPVAVVTLLRDGSMLAYNDAFVENMDADTRAQAVATALSSSEDSGIDPESGVLYRRSVGTNSIALAFVDATGVMETVRGTMLGAASVFLGALAVVFALSIMLARVITGPVRRAWDAQAQFVADASHELKTPLTVVLANADILEGSSGGLSPEQLKWVEGIRTESRRMKGLVEEMLFLARSGNAPDAGADRTDVDLSALVRRSCLAFDAVAFESSVELSDQVDNGVTVRGDPEQLERLVKSLVDNAVKYAGGGGSVKVALSGKRKGHPVLSVTNTGEPIPPEDLPRVFDRFWRSDAARSGSGGGSYGLGLAIAKSIAEAQGARISVTSSREAGTTFTVAF